VEKGLTRQALYVACSRARTLSGLYIEGRFVPPTCLKDDPIELEMQRLAERSVKMEVVENPKYFILHAFDSAMEGKHMHGRDLVLNNQGGMYITSENAQPPVWVRPKQEVGPKVIEYSTEYV
jgi:hypothetical protein